MTYQRPRFISERERAEVWVDGRSRDDARWEDCAPCSVAMLVDAHTGGVKPRDKSLNEAELLRFAAGYGPTGGTNIQQLAATAVTRYRIPLPRYATGFEEIWKALKPGYGAAIAGSMAAFGNEHKLSRHQRWFDGAHSVYVARMDGVPRVLWLDPLAPKGYTGDWVSRADLRLFFSKGVAAAVVLPLARVAAEAA